MHTVFILALGGCYHRVNILQRSERFLSLDMLRALDSKVFMISSSRCSVSSLSTQILKKIYIKSKKKKKPQKTKNHPQTENSSVPKHSR